MVKMEHKSVLVEEICSAFHSAKNGIVVDATCGEGGHSIEILKRVQPLKLLAIDVDKDILEKAKKNIGNDNRVTFINANFIELEDILKKENISKVDAILFDLGISKYHYLKSGRGFSFNADEPLDMRLSLSQKLTAFDVVNYYSEDKLKKILWAFGEERFSVIIARKIVEERKKKKIQTAKQLAEIISKTVPKKFYDKIHPATKTFQALRIEVNSELLNLEYILEYAAKSLNSKGKLAVITFHSLEDRIVKHKFCELSTGEVIDELRGIKKQAEYVVVTKKPVEPSQTEIRLNPSSRSAKLRILEKI